MRKDWGPLPYNVPSFLVLPLFFEGGRVVQRGIMYIDGNYSSQIACTALIHYTITTEQAGPQVYLESTVLISCYYSFTGRDAREMCTIDSL